MACQKKNKAALDLMQLEPGPPLAAAGDLFFSRQARGFAVLWMMKVQATCLAINLPRYKMAAGRLQTSTKKPKGSQPGYVTNIAIEMEVVLWENHGNIWGYPLVICSIAIEDCHL